MLHFVVNERNNEILRLKCLVSFTFLLQEEGIHDKVQDKTFSKFFNNHIGVWHCSNQGASWTK